jgi:DNA-binding transcriptional regulator YbjK
MGRTEQLLTAAVEVVADGGMRGLTHRAVDARAGPLPVADTLAVRVLVGAALDADLG